LGGGDEEACINPALTGLRDDGGGWGVCYPDRPVCSWRGVVEMTSLKGTDKETGK